MSDASNRREGDKKQPGLIAATEKTGNRFLNRSEANREGRDSATVAAGLRKEDSSRRSLELHVSLALAVLVSAAFLLLSCAGNGDDGELLDISRPPLELEAIFEPESAAGILENRLRNSLELDEVIVTYEHSNHTVRVQFEHPHGMNTHQLMILYLAVFVAAENYLPYSQRVEMHMALDGVPFLALCVGVDSLRAFINGEVERDDFYRSLEVTVPGTS